MNITVYTPLSGSSTLLTNGIMLYPLSSSAPITSPEGEMNSRYPSASGLSVLTEILIGLFIIPELGTNIHSSMSPEYSISASLLIPNRAIEPSLIFSIGGGVGVGV